MTKPSDPAATRGKSRVKGSERRAKFLDAAAAIIVEHGVSAVTMDEVALRTEVNKRLGYRYFANREDLLHGLFEQEMAKMSRAAAELTPPDPTLADVVSANIRAWLDMTERDGPILSRLFSDQAVIPNLGRAILDRATHNWAVTLGDPLDLPPPVGEILARIYLAALRGAVETLLAGTASAAQIADIYATAVLGGAEAVAARFGTSLASSD